ncbi:hypothetical protein [Dactylosporangium matsuzakiense]|uniref:Uncharacterized protein n=1 Tax=Dactylosporangium matsuzakiense TaxID=53360 RepID=A0A9W6NSJ2_9ACTN|nr:hypothetical protein [Dactylosporangium matsuzakiense]UWZ48104.1 hypothetical protein Dmats_17890 [Dactylosporangium matsuzakiense]GLL08410.1 hypothetical protein GCM10017581_101710 [Dactylosporangium matsuzakiense]
MPDDPYLDSIVAIVRKVSPPEAVRSVFEAEVDEHYTGMRMQFEGEDGPLDSSRWAEFADPWSEELTNTLLDLRDAMVAEGSLPRFGLTFTVDRDAGFDVTLTYDMPADLPWVH